MPARPRHRFWLYLTIGLLIAQAMLFWWSFHGFLEISIFCTAAEPRWLAMMPYVHFVYAGLFVLGLISLPWSRSRPVYVILLCIALPALPVQAHRLASGQLHCDAM